MGRRVSQYEARGFGENHGVGVALAGAAQVEGFGLERHMDVFGHIVGVEHEAVVGVSALVEYLGVQQVERAEVGAYFLELYAPFGEAVACAYRLGVLQLAEGFHKAGAGNEYLSLGAAVAGEGGAAQVDEVGFGEFAQRHGVGACRLLPYASGEIYVLVLGGVEEACALAEYEVLFHAEAHVDDCGLFLVGEVPAHFFLGNLGEGALFYLHLENLAVVGILLRKGGELRRLHVELGGGAPHSHQTRSCRQSGHID